MPDAQPDVGISMPPALQEFQLAADEDPLTQSTARAHELVSASIFWRPRTDRFMASLVVLPDRTLAESMLTVFAVACGLHDCLGALTPPETTVKFGWPNRILLNGATCGRLCAVAPTDDLNAIPTWLAVAIELDLAPMGENPGAQPERTSLAEEGCGQLTVRTILPSWARHTLVWIYTWTEDGPRPLLDEWLSHANDHRQAVQIQADGSLLQLALIHL